MKFKLSWAIFFGIGLIGGILIGMTLQQAIYTTQLEKFASNLDGVEINVAFNETKLIEGITNFYTPYFEEMINESGKEMTNEEWVRRVYNNGTGIKYNPSDANVALGEGGEK